MERDGKAGLPDDLLDGSEVSPEASPASGEGFRSLDGRTVTLWRTSSALGLGGFLAILVIGGGVLWGLVGVPWVLPVAIWLAVGLWLLITLLWWLPRKHAAWSFRFAERILELRFGIYRQVAILIPLSRVQHVDLSRGPLERHFGLASVDVHTAGTQNASFTIPGLAYEDAHDLRERLIRAADLDVE